MAKMNCKLVKKTAGAKLAGAPVKATTSLSFMDFQNGTGTFAGQDAAGNDVPLDPAIWSVGASPVISDTTIVSSVTVSGLGVTFVGTGKVGTLDVTFTISTSDGSVPDTVVDVPLTVTLGPAKTPVFVPGTPIVR